MSSVPTEKRICSGLTPASGFANYANVLVKEVFHLDHDLAAPLLVGSILVSVVGA